MAVTAAASSRASRPSTTASTGRQGQGGVPGLVLPRIFCAHGAHNGPKPRHIGDGACRRPSAGRLEQRRPRSGLPGTAGCIGLRRADRPGNRRRRIEAAIVDTSAGDAVGQRQYGARVFTILDRDCQQTFRIDCAGRRSEPSHETGEPPASPSTGRGAPEAGSLAVAQKRNLACDWIVANWVRTKLRDAIRRHAAHPVCPSRRIPPAPVRALNSVSQLTLTGDRVGSMGSC